MQPKLLENSYWRQICYFTDSYLHDVQNRRDPLLLIGNDVTCYTCDVTPHALNGDIFQLPTNGSTNVLTIKMHLLFVFFRSFAAVFTSVWQALYAGTSRSVGSGTIHSCRQQPETAVQ